MPGFTKAQIDTGVRKLRRDEAFKKALSKKYPGPEAFTAKLRKLFELKVPAKYLGIELGTSQRPRFSYAEVAWLRLQPRKLDGVRKGLKRSPHAQRFHDELPKIAAELDDNDRFVALCNQAARGTAAAFAKSKFHAEITPVLKRLQRATGVPADVAFEVLKKGAYAYNSSHRSGMTRFGWARARLSSFLFKGCTYYSPDHLLVAEARARSPKARLWWDGHRQCLCRKRGQCGKGGKQVPANAIRRRGSKFKRPQI